MYIDSLRILNLYNFTFREAQSEIPFVLQKVNVILTGVEMRRDETCLREMPKV